MAETKTKKTKASEKSVKSDKNKPDWLKTEEKDIKAIITKLAKKNLTSEKIGLVLRDSYGIPKTKALGKSISEILKSNELYKDADLTNLEKKQEEIKKHLTKNKQDKVASRTLTMLNQKIKKLKTYRARKNK